MNTKKTLLFIIFLLFVFLVSLANAQEDFTATSSPSIELCPCSNQAYTVTVENTGTVASLYKVLAGSDIAKWVNFNPSRFILNPGQKGSFFVFVNSDCNIEGDYDLEIFITTNNGLTKVIKQVLKFSQCYDYSLELGNVIDEANESIKFLPHDDFYALCKNEQKIMPILITNNEDFENRYSLFLDAPEWATINIDNVKLGAKKSGVFLINLDTTDVEGEFNFKLNAISELGKVQRKKRIEVDVGECYALEVELEKEKDVICGGEEKSYNTTIKNTGTLGQNVKLDLDAPEWADIKNASFYLRPEQERILKLNVGPDDNVSGNFLVIAFAVIENKTKFSDEIKIDVASKLECYKADMSTKTSVTNYYREDLFFARVKNDGIKKVVYNVDLEGIYWVSVSPKTLELNPGQIGNLNLNVKPGADVEAGTYGVKIILESNDAVYSKNVDIVLKKESEFWKNLKLGIKSYQYYIYLLILLVILIIIFMKPLKEVKAKIKKHYEKYEVKKTRLEALKLAREKGREIKKEKKEEKVIKKERKKKFKVDFKKYQVWIYLVIL